MAVMVVVLVVFVVALLAYILIGKPSADTKSPLKPDVEAMLRMGLERWFFHDLKRFRRRFKLLDGRGVAAAMIAVIKSIRKDLPNFRIRENGKAAPSGSQVNKYLEQISAHLKDSDSFEAGQYFLMFLLLNCAGIVPDNGERVGVSPFELGREETAIEGLFGSTINFILNAHASKDDDFAEFCDIYESLVWFYFS